MSTRHIQLLCLLLVAVFLGHDGLMAVEGAAVPHHPTGVDRHDDSRRLSPHHSALPGLDVPGSGHLEDCGVGHRAVARRGDDVEADHSPPALANTVVVATQAQRRAEVSAWVEPQWPPGTHRALLQVYRI